MGVTCNSSSNYLRKNVPDLYSYTWSDSSLVREFFPEPLGCKTTIPLPSFGLRRWSRRLKLTTLSVDGWEVHICPNVLMSEASVRISYISKKKEN